MKEVAITTNGKRGVFAIVGEPFPQIKAAAYVRDAQGRVVVDGVSGNPLVGDVEKSEFRLLNNVRAEVSSL